MSTSYGACSVVAASTDSNMKAATYVNAFSFEEPLRGRRLASGHVHVIRVLDAETEVACLRRSGLHLQAVDQKSEYRGPRALGTFWLSGKVQIRSIRVMLPSAYSQISWSPSR